MADAYVEAAYFTDEEHQHDGYELTSIFKNDAYRACRNFEDACDALSIDLRAYDPDQLGHDLWLTRNGHGAGFWDRDFEHKDIFTAFARAQGTHDAEFA